MGASPRSKTPTTLAKAVSGIAASATSLPAAVFLLAILFVAVVIGVVVGWQRWGRAVMVRPVYRIAAENIRLTPPPAWIRTDVRSEVVRDGALNDLTIFDRDVTIRVYQAFELHPWVAKVNRVSKHPPARLEVELEYRQPVAWIEVPRDLIPGTNGGVIPVDQHSVVLPSRDFSEQNLADYLLVSIAGVSPCGLAGSPWGDARVVGAAKLATLLGDHWKAAGLLRIRVSAGNDEPGARGTNWLYELETRGRRRVIWGATPEAEVPLEPSTQTKLTRLRQLLAAVPNLDQSSQAVWDLRLTEFTPSRHDAP